MANEFSQGLLAGFQFVDSLQDRRRRRDLQAEQLRQQNERLGLARSANERAERLTESQLRTAEDLRTRQARTDESNSLLAEFEMVGFDNMSPTDQQRFLEHGDVNPEIAKRIRENSELMAGAEALQARLGGGLAGAAAQAIPQQQQAAPGVSADQIGFVTQGATEGVAALPEGPRGEIITAPKSMLADLLPGLDVDALPTAGANGVNVPATLLEELQGIEDMPVVEQERLRRRAKARLGSLDSAITMTSLADTANKTTLQKWGDFIDPQNEAGSTLRTLASDDPVQTATMFHSELATLQRRDQNLASMAMAQMQQPVQEALDQVTNEMANFVSSGDLTSEEAVRTQQQFNQLLDLKQNMSDDFDDRAEARVRGDVLRIGVPRIASELRADLEETGQPGMPATDAQNRTRSAMAHRAGQQVLNGDATSLSTRQIRDLGFLVKNGVISPSGYENLLTHGTFEDPKDFEFFNGRLDQPMFRNNGDGTITKIWEPSAAQLRATSRGGNSLFGDTQMKFVNDVFAIPDGASPEIAEGVTRTRLNFVATITDPELMGQMMGANFDMGDWSQVPSEDLAFLALRYKAMEATADAFNERYFGNGRFLGFGGGTGLPADINITNFDEFARKYLPEEEWPPAWRRLSTDTAAARPAMISQGNMDQVILGLTGEPPAIDAEIRSAIEASAQ